MPNTLNFEMPSHSPFYRKNRWRVLRSKILKRRPVCEADGCFNRSEHVDHIIPISQGGSGFDQSNLQVLCRRCHGRKTADDNGHSVRARSEALGRSYEVGLDGWGVELDGK